MFDDGGGSITTATSYNSGGGGGGGGGGGEGMSFTAASASPVTDNPPEDGAKTGAVPVSALAYPIGELCCCILVLLYPIDEWSCCFVLNR